MSTNAAKQYMGDAPVGDVTKRGFSGKAANDFSYDGISLAFKAESNRIAEHSTRHIPHNSESNAQDSDNLSHLEANPWIKTMKQQIIEKLSAGRISSALEQIKDVMRINFAHGTELADTVLTKLEDRGHDDIANMFSAALSADASINAYAASGDGLSSPASTAAQEELFTGSARFTCEDYTAKELKDTQEAYKRHQLNMQLVPTLPAFLGRG